MTDKELMATALEELAGRFSEGWHEGIKIDASDIMLLSQAAEALAQPEQEPVAWLSIDSIGERYLCFDKPLDNDPVQPLYTHPPQRTEPILSLQCFHCQDTIETLNDKVMHLLAQRTEQNFCSRCGKRTKDLTHIHTCTPPKD
jgi:hypothetical protein